MRKKLHTLIISGVLFLGTVAYTLKPEPRFSTKDYKQKRKLAMKQGFSWSRSKGKPSH